MRNIITKEQLAQMQELYKNGMGGESIAKQFGLHPNSVRRALNRAGDSKVTRNVKEANGKFTDDQITNMINEYKSFDLDSKPSCKALGKKHNMDAMSVYNYLKSNNIEVRKNEDAHRKLKLKMNCFDDLTNELTAYFLGFFCADGNVSNDKKYLKVEIHQMDKDILYTFADMFYQENAKDRVKIFDREKKGKIYKHCKIQVSSKKLAAKMISLGIGPAKSLTLDFPKWAEDEKVFPHFVRGYFDGDGGINEGKNGTFSSKMCVSKNFGDSLKELFKKYNIESEMYKHEDNKIHLLNIFNSKNIDNFRKLIYKDATVFLDRKKHRFDKLETYVAKREEIISRYKEKIYDMMDTEFSLKEMEDETGLSAKTLRKVRDDKDKNELDYFITFRTLFKKEFAGDEVIMDMLNNDDRWYNKSGIDLEKFDDEEYDDDDESDDENE